MENQLKKFVGVGWRFPFRITGKTGGIAKSGGENSQDSIQRISQSIQQILGTILNERFIRRDFGSDLLDRLFDPGGSSFDASIKSFIRDSILKFEKRVVVTTLEINRANILSGLVNIFVEFLIINTQQVGNLVYPLYSDIDRTNIQ